MICLLEIALYVKKPLIIQMPGFVESVTKDFTGEDVGNGETQIMNVITARRRKMNDKHVDKVVLTKYGTGTEKERAVVIGYYSQPTFLLEDLKGNQFTWAASLCEELPPEEQIEFFRDRIELLEREVLNLQNEPDYPLHETVVVSLRDPNMVCHQASKVCPHEAPHDISECNLFDH